MPKQPSEFVEYVIGSLAMLGPVRAKSMFGGWGIFCDDLMFGLVADDELSLKVDTQNQPQKSPLRRKPRARAIHPDKSGIPRHPTSHSLEPSGPMY